MSGNATTIRLREVDNGAVKIELNSGGGSFVLNLHNKSCDPLVEFGETLLQMYDYSQSANTEASFPKNFFIFWECRNYQYTLEFTLLSKEDMELKISYCPDIFAGIRTENDLQLTILTRLETLLQDYFAQLKKILLAYGFIGYKDRWRRHDFPAAMFLRLYAVTNEAKITAGGIPCCLQYLQTIIRGN
ncbi:MAG: hypothetical protein PHV59_10465 [Victivallales bacterium]|nr:hypothetical protein [Victivallales bacterium]